MNIYRMKKNLIIFLSLPLFLFWCTNNTANEIDAETRQTNEWLTANQEFSQQIKESKIISDFSNFFSEAPSSLKNNDFLVSTTDVNWHFDEQSSVIGNISFRKSTTKSNIKDELSEITFDINSESKDNSDPLVTSWNLSLLYKNWWLYTMLHNFWIYMWEWNMNAKIYGLFANLLIDRRIDLEVNNEWGIVSVSDDTEPSEIINSFIEFIIMSNDSNDHNIIISKNAETFLNFIDSYTKLWFSTEWLTLSDSSESFSTFSDWTIQKFFSWDFTCNETSFILTALSSAKWFEIAIWNIHSLIDNSDLDYEISISIEENKSDYHLKVTTIKSWQHTLNIDWNIRFNDSLNFDGNVILQPLQLIAWQKISGNINWTISREISTNFEFPQLTWNILLLHEVLEAM